MKGVNHLYSLFKKWFRIEKHTGKCTDREYSIVEENKISLKGEVMAKY